MMRVAPDINWQQPTGDKEHSKIKIVNKKRLTGNQMYVKYMLTADRKLAEDIRPMRDHP
jgi:hypothetical protein